MAAGGLCCGLELAPNSAPKWLKQTFDEADKNGDGSLSMGEVLQLLHKLNVKLPRQRVKQMFRVSMGTHGWGWAGGPRGRWPEPFVGGSRAWDYACPLHSRG